MNRIYLSFLGLGHPEKGYDKTIYSFNGEESSETKFIQVAEVEILKKIRSDFQKIIIVCTEKSHEKYYDELKAALEKITSAVIKYEIINADLNDTREYWEWFESFLKNIDAEDKLTMDLTHGFRAIPIIFSSAISFLQKSKNIELEGAYYAFYDKDKKVNNLTDMKDFYIINEWAEGVSRLIEDADSKKLATLCEISDLDYAPELKDKKVIAAFSDLTDFIRNININHIGEKTDKAIKIIEEKRAKASGISKILLDAVYDKFISLSIKESVSGFYDKEYFNNQLQIIDILIKHQLFMQAYTVMREFIASIGMIGYSRLDKKDSYKKVSNNAGRRKRHQYGEIFISMLQFAKDEWNFTDDRQKYADELKSFYNSLTEAEILEHLRSLTKKIVEIRNGFDHAWTGNGKKKNNQEIKTDAESFLDGLKDIIKGLEDKGFLYHIKDISSHGEV